MTMIRCVATICALAALAPAAGAAQRSSDLWATVNVCDTAAHPNTIGIRGSMPGLRRRSALRVRYRVQYRDRRGRWRAVGRRADSGWRTAGTRARGRVESGWSFRFAPPAAGAEVVLRGVVSFQWRRGGRVVRRARRITEGGHVSTRGADPPGYSAGTCRIV